MKLSGLKWPFSLRPQSTVNVPRAPFCCSALFTFTPAGTFAMSRKNDGSASSALASPVRPAVVATTMPPTASASASPPVAIFVRRVMRCLPVAGVRGVFRAKVHLVRFSGHGEDSCVPGLETRGTRGAAPGRGCRGRARCHWFRH
jgi:hypothetical protein